MRGFQRWRSPPTQRPARWRRKSLFHCNRFTLVQNLWYPTLWQTLLALPSAFRASWRNSTPHSEHHMPETPRPSPPSLMTASQRTMTLVSLTDFSVLYGTWRIGVQSQTEYANVKRRSERCDKGHCMEGILWKRIYTLGVCGICIAIVSCQCGLLAWYLCMEFHMLGWTRRSARRWGHPSTDMNGQYPFQRIPALTSSASRC